MVRQGMVLLLGVLVGSACSASSSDSPRDSVLGDPPEDFIASCTRLCGLTMRLDRLPCTPGEAIRHGERLGSGKNPEEPPVSEDPECMASCLQPPTSFPVECWRQLGALYDCEASAIWICDSDGSGWNSTQCGHLGEDPAICWEQR